MKKIAIICTLLLALLGVTFPYLNGQNVKPLKKETKKGNSHTSISKHDDSQSIELEQENGKILKFSINGRTIPASEYANYQSMIDGLLADIPEPPAAPDMPLPPVPPSPPNYANSRQNEATFETVLEAQMEAQKVHLKMMYEEKARIRKEAIEAAQARKGE